MAARQLNAGRSESDLLCRWCWEPCTQSMPGVRWEYPAGPAEYEKRERGEPCESATLIVHVDHLDLLEKTGGDKIHRAVSRDVSQGVRALISV